MRIEVVLTHGYIKAIRSGVKLLNRELVKPRPSGLTIKHLHKRLVGRFSVGVFQASKNAGNDGPAMIGVGADELDIPSLKKIIVPTLPVKSFGVFDPSYKGRRRLHCWPLARDICC